MKKLLTLLIAFPYIAGLFVFFANSFNVAIVAGAAYAYLFSPIFIAVAFFLGREYEAEKNMMKGLMKSLK